jgi:two-component system nitrogen regulation sensor histidine kinase GlnL
MSIIAKIPASIPLDVPSSQVLGVLPHPIMTLDASGRIVDANAACEAFFQIGQTQLQRSRLADLLPFGSPILNVAEEARLRRATINEYRIDVSTPRIGPDRIVDVNVIPLLPNAEFIVIMLQERTIADKMDRQLTHRGAARSVSALAAMLAHESKNPLSGIRGAAQLLEPGLDDSDRSLTRLICDETDRIVKLVDRMEAFSDERPSERAAVNIHFVLDHVKRVAQAGFGRHVRFVETYDPSLPPVNANRDQLIQVFLNLVKNAVEAIGEDAIDGEIELTTAFRSGVRMRVAGSSQPVALPLEFCVRDNGPGVSSAIMDNLFDPFVTNKASGTGLGLALVAKIVGDHGGMIECDSHPRRTVFRVLMPMFSPRDGRQSTTT